MSVYCGSFERDGFCCLGEDLLETDLRPNDCYALLAAHLIVDIGGDTGVWVWCLLCYSCDQAFIV